jgi:hypothetical protein
VSDVRPVDDAAVVHFGLHVCVQFVKEADHGHELASQLVQGLEVFAARLAEEIVVHGGCAGVAWDLPAWLM